MEFKVGDRVEFATDSSTKGTIRRITTNGWALVQYDHDGSDCHAPLSWLVPATTAAPETPRAFVVGDRALSKGGEEVTVTRVAGDHVAVRWDDGQNTGNLHPASLFTLVTPAAPADPAWVLRERLRLPPRWTLTSEGRPVLNGPDPAYRLSVDGRSPPRGAILCELDMGGDGIVRWVKSGARQLDLPDPYATTVEDGAAKLPPMPSDPPTPYCSECGEELGMLGATMCGDCCDASAYGCRATHESRCNRCLATKVGERPDLSLTNEIGLPTLPPPTVVADTSPYKTDLWKSQPARPVPVAGDIVEWKTPVLDKQGRTVDHLLHEGLVVPTDGNGNKPVAGYLWVRRKHEGKTAYTCVAVERTTIVEMAGER